MSDLSPGDVVWITGASTGIGAALAENMARDGFIVAASARSADKLNALAEQDYGAGRVLAYPLDVTDKEAQRQVLAKITAQLGPIKGAVLNAGTYEPDDGQNLNMDAIRKQFELNVFSVLDGITALVPLMKKSGGGSIAIVSSVAGYTGLPRAVGYGGSKAALINMAEALKLDLAAMNIKMQLICPGFVKTPLTDKNTFPMPFLIGVEQAAEAITVGLQSKRFEIVFPFQMAIVMKILRILPYRLYFWLVKRQTGVANKKQPVATKSAAK